MARAHWREYAFWISALTLVSLVISAGSTYIWFEIDPACKRSDVQLSAILLPLIIAPLCTALIVREKIKVATLAAENLRLAETAPLTGLLNRRAFYAQAERLRAGIGGRGAFFLLVADIDHFKSINDHFGHLAGDTVLEHVSARLGALINGDMRLARFGGEEFIIAGWVSTPLDAYYFGEKLVRAVEDASVVCAGSRIQATVSVGICVVQAEDPLEAAIDRADAAMYEAKRDGRNRAVASTDEARALA